jgi:hypothetical protein
MERYPDPDKNTKEKHFRAKARLHGKPTNKYWSAASYCPLREDAGYLFSPYHCC